MGGGGVIAGYWHVKISPRLDHLEGRFDDPAPSRAKSVRLSPATGELSRSSQALPGEPSGLAWNGRAFVACNRVEPWGFLRIVPEGERLSVQRVPVIEHEYGQRVGFEFVAWDGERYVAYTSGSWFGSNLASVFTLHDPESLAILDWKPAPENLGALVWTGEHYLAGTRNATSDDSAEPRLLRLDRDLRVVEEIPGGARGCQGLAWDGGRLWAVDVFEDALLELDPDTGATLSERGLPLGYLSGLAWAGRDLWIGEYGSNALHVVDPGLLGVNPGLLGRGGSGEALASTELFGSHSGDEGLWQTPSHASAGEGEAASRGPAEIELQEMRVELVDGELRASWSYWFGHELFSEAATTGEGFMSMPLFNRYTISVEGKGLSREIEIEHEAQPGLNEGHDVVLARALPPGEYEVSLFGHSQHVKPDGGAMILNDSAAWLSVAH